MRLDGEFAQGATGRLKPKGGPAVSFVVEKLTDREFVDVSALFGARLTFSHVLERTGELTAFDVDITISGPLARLWARILGKDLAAAAQPDVDNLITTIEAAAP